MKIIFILCVLFIISCSKLGVVKLLSHDIVKLSEDTYVLQREDHGGYLGKSSSLEDTVIRDANAFAKSLGKAAIPISSRATPAGKSPTQWASFEYKFRVVDEDDPETKRVSLVPGDDAATKYKTEQSTDMYTELIRLDDLRKKGIITDKEFQTQKNKILNKY